MLTQRKIGLFQSDTVDVALPPELVLYILCFFTFRELLPPACMGEVVGSPFLVCRDFARLASEGLLWGNVFERTHGVRFHGEGPSLLTIFKICYQYMQHLDVKHSAIFPGRQANFEDLHASVLLHDKDTKHKPWTTFLLGAFCESPHSLTQPGNNLVSQINKSRLLFLDAANVHRNPFAMLQLAEDCLETKQKLLWLEKAVASDCTEAKYQAALQYFDLSLMKEYFLLLLQAAKRGHAAAANRLIYCYLAKVDEHEYIPFGQEEWEILEIMYRVAQITDATQVNSEDVKKDKATILSYAFQRIPLAAWYCSKLYQTGYNLFDLKQNFVTYAHFKTIAEEAHKSNFPSRKERAMYWLNEAVKGGNKDAFELLTQSFQPEPSSPKV